MVVIVNFKHAITTGLFVRVWYVIILDGKNKVYEKFGLGSGCSVILISGGCGGGKTFFLLQLL